MKKVTFASKPAKDAKQPVNADQWIGMANRPDPGERTKRLTIDVPLSLHQRIKCTCAMQGEKMADVIRDLLIEKFPDTTQGE